MKRTWNAAVRAIDPRDYQLEQVLVEYDGPQVATFRGPEGLCLGVAADEDEHLIRWICSQITNTEYRALLDGAVSIRDALLKPQVYVLDVHSDGRVVSEWQFEGPALDESVIPDRDAKLPKAVRQALASSPLQTPEIRIDSVRTQKIGFASLADLLSSVQRLWLAIAHVREQRPLGNKGRWSPALTEKSMLSLSGAAAGSLILQVEPADPSTFETVAETFECLTQASDSAEGLARELNPLGPRVQGRYAELLSHLAKHGLQMLSRRPGGGSAFLASHFATRILSSLPKESTKEPHTISTEGYFIAFNTRNQTYEFYDMIGDETYHGSVHPEVFLDNLSVGVGSGTFHRVEIEVVNCMTTTPKNSRICTLRSIEK